MKPERWQQIEQLYHAALERRAEERAIFLAEVCGGDEALRREVAVLLAADARAEQFIETPPSHLAADWLTQSPSHLDAGQQLSHYWILSLLGAGGMGEVYLAQDVRLKRKIALKLLPAKFTQDEERVRRFEREALAVSALNHPNIITIHEIGQSGDLHFIATEFIDGQTLRRQMDSARLKLTDALEIATQVAAALVAAHAAGITHRDIKPENVMVRPDGLVKVLDFGLAKLAELPAPAIDADAPTRARVETEPGMVMGTVRYMSPEQVRGQKVDARTDLFSLGVVLYEMIAAEGPFAGATSADVSAAILGQEPAPLAASAPDVPAALEWIVAKALRKECEERYQTAKELFTDLKRLKQELEIEVRLGRPIRSEWGHDATTSGPQERVTAETGGVAAVSTGGLGSAPATSSAEYLVRRLQEYKRGVMVAFVALVVAISALAFYFTQGSPAIDSIAVLPLANTSADPNTEYLSDGVTESLINQLTRLRNLRVMARTTAFRYKGKEVDPQRVGRELGVRAVLMGRVQPRGGALILQVDLINVADGTQLWGEQYHWRMAELLVVQQEMAREIAEKLRLRLSGEERKQLTKRETSDPEAYRLYLKGRYYWNKRSAEGNKQAIEQFRQAIDRDPNYALAYVGLADCYLLLEKYTGAPSSETFPKAKAFAERALQLDDSLAEAHTSLGDINTSMWQFREAETEFRQALTLNPNYPTAHHWYSIYLRVMGRSDEAAAEIQRAQELDPLSPMISYNIALLYLLRGDLKAAIAQCQKIIELELGHEDIIVGRADQNGLRSGVEDGITREAAGHIKISRPVDGCAADLSHPRAAYLKGCCESRRCGVGLGAPSSPDNRRSVRFTGGCGAEPGRSL